MVPNPFHIANKDISNICSSIYLPSKLQEVPSTILALVEPHGLYEDGEAEYVRVEVQLQVAVDQLPPRLAGVEGEPVQC